MNDAEKHRLFEILKNEEEKWNEEEKINPELIWNPKAIFEDLQKNHIKIEESKTWPEWKIYYLELPAVWKFKWVKFCCIASNSEVSYHSFIRNGWYNASFSGKKLWKIWGYLLQYLKEYWIKFDELDLMDDDEFNDSMVQLLQAVLWLKGRYWLTDDGYDNNHQAIVDFDEWCISYWRTDSITAGYGLLLEPYKIEPDTPIPHNERGWPY